MNVALIDPFRKSFPESVIAALPDDFTTTLAFSHDGTLIATGCVDGRVVLLDYVTRNPVKTYYGHVLTISCLSWSADSRYLASAAYDWKVNIWDTKLGIAVQEVLFESAVLTVQIHPTRRDTWLACPSHGSPMLFRKDRHVKVLDDYLTEQDLSTVKLNLHTATWIDETWILIGDGNGVVWCVHTDVSERFESRVIWKAKFSTASVRGIVFSNNRREMLVNTMDRQIGHFLVVDPDELHHSGIHYEYLHPHIRNAPIFKLYQKLVDVASRAHWTRAIFTSNDNFVLGAQPSHAIHIWDRKTGGLLKVLDMPSKSAGGLLDVAWHPTAPVIASVSYYGQVFVLGIPSLENWSAFWPAFQEMDENVEYAEKECEFDEAVIDFHDSPGDEGGEWALCPDGEHRKVREWLVYDSRAEPRPKDAEPATISNETGRGAPDVPNVNIEFGTREPVAEGSGSLKIDWHSRHKSDFDRLVRGKNWRKDMA